MARIDVVEVWHGGIPAQGSDVPGRLPLCPLAYDCPDGMGEHSHRMRISHAPFSVPWRLWMRTHPGAWVLHVVRPGAIR